MSDNIDDEVLERLEAEATVADAEPEELTIAVESDIESKEEEVEELQDELETKEAEIEELGEAVEAKEEEIEEMSEQIDAVAEDYAEELAKDSDVLDQDDFLDKFEFEELQEKYNDLDTAGPAPNSGDPGAGFQEANGEGEGSDGGSDADVTEKEELAADQFRERAKKTGKQYWVDIADEIEAEE